MDIGSLHTHLALLPSLQVPSHRLLVACSFLHVNICNETSTTSTPKTNTHGHMSHS